MAKKPKTEALEIQLPIPAIAFYEGVAAYSGVKFEDVIRVVLALHLLKDKPTGDQNV